ncbi:hypothetical protein MNBD_GAMMA22-722 [hydrothermal vent metagenome]|uniref:Ig-like SoxY domain-containing protein n=1 Tax=hydrothermal vent metagenome TaxID=652676 RepID=A0A3B1A103_9ZZZZ
MRGSNDASTNTLDDKLVEQPFETAMAIYDTVTGDINNYISTDIIIEAPSRTVVNEINGSVIPVTITIPAGAGTLWVFIDSNSDKPAARIDIIEPTGEPQSITTRVKMMGPGNIIAVFDDGSSTLRANTQRVDVTINGTLTKCPVSPCVLPEFSVENIQTAATEKKGIFQMLITHDMYVENYISSISLFVNNVVSTNVYFTPYIAKNNHLSIFFKKPVTTLQYLLKQSNGNSVSNNIPLS